MIASRCELLGSSPVLLHVIVCLASEMTTDDVLVEVKLRGNVGQRCTIVWSSNSLYLAVICHYQIRCALYMM